MCRVLSYLGNSILIKSLLYEPDNSFIKQSYHPKYMGTLLNLAGFGIAAWDSHSPNPAFPSIYKTPHLPFYDENLKNLSEKTHSQCFLAHLRGVSYTEKQVISQQNVHPFLFPESNIALAHNGALVHFEIMKYDLLPHIKTEYHKDIKGTTDSEWIYAVFLSQLPQRRGKFSTTEIIDAITKTLKIIQQVRKKHNITIASAVNLFISDGEYIAATRFVFDYGWLPSTSFDTTHSTYHSLWYTYGEEYGFFNDAYRMRGNEKKTSMIIASEPLTEDTTTWIEVPEYTVLVAKKEGDTINIISQDLEI